MYGSKRRVVTEFCTFLGWKWGFGSWNVANKHLRVSLAVVSVCCFIYLNHIFCQHLPIWCHLTLSQQRHHCQFQRSVLSIFSPWRSDAAIQLFIKPARIGEREGKQAKNNLIKVWKAIVKLLTITTFSKQTVTRRLYYKRFYSKTSYIFIFYIGNAITAWYKLKYMISTWT